MPAEIYMLECTKKPIEIVEAVRSKCLTMLRERENAIDTMVAKEGWWEYIDMYGRLRYSQRVRCAVSNDRLRSLEEVNPVVVKRLLVELR